MRVSLKVVSVIHKVLQVRLIIFQNLLWGGAKRLSWSIRLKNLYLKANSRECRSRWKISARSFIIKRCTMNRFESTIYNDCCQGLTLINIMNKNMKSGWDISTILIVIMSRLYWIRRTNMKEIPILRKQIKGTINSSIRMIF